MVCSVTPTGGPGQGWACELCVINSRVVIENGLHALRCPLGPVAGRLGVPAAGTGWQGRYTRWARLEACKVEPGHGVRSMELLRIS